MVANASSFNKIGSGTGSRSAKPRPAVIICAMTRFPASVEALCLFELFTKIVILGFAFWAIYATASALMGVTIYFSLRVSVFLTFTYFAVIHLVNGSREMFPIKFLETYLVILTIAGFAIFIREGVDAGKYAIVGFFGVCVCVLILNQASRPKFRRYFSKS